MVKLTDIQADMLLHRLDADDCIVAAFLDTHEDDPPSAYKEAEIVDAIARLAEMVQSRTLPDHLEGVMADVLAECIEGSACGVVLTMRPRASSSCHRGCGLDIPWSTRFPRSLVAP